MQKKADPSFYSVISTCLMRRINVKAPHTGNKLKRQRSVYFFHRKQNAVPSTSIAKAFEILPSIEQKKTVIFPLKHIWPFRCKKQVVLSVPSYIEASGRGRIIAYIIPLPDRLIIGTLSTTFWTLRGDFNAKLRIRETWRSPPFCILNLLHLSSYCI